LRESKNNKLIIQYLRSIGISCPPAIISKETGIPANVVRVVCCRLYNKGRIEKDLRGFYRVHLTLESLLEAEQPDLKLHGIKIEGIIPESNSNKATLPLLLHYQTNNVNASGNRHIEYWTFEGRRVSVMTSQNGTLELFIDTDKQPLDYDLFMQFIGFLNAKFDNWVPLLKLKVTQLGINYDFNKWRMEGIKAVTLKAFANVLLQIYQKEKGILRLESHLNDRVSMGDAINILQGIKRQMEDRIKPPAPGMFH